MRPLTSSSLWLGHAGDARDLRGLLSAGFAAVVDLAVNELPLSVTRELVYCRLPLVDGAGNPPWLLQAAIETTAALARSNVKTLVFCAAGMSRSPVIAAAALARAQGRPAEECLAEVLHEHGSDVSPALWNEAVAALAGLPGT